MTDEHYDFMELDIDNAKALEAVADGETVGVTIVDVYPNPEKAYCRVRLEINEGAYKDITAFINFPREGDTTKQIASTTWRAKQFCDSFELTSDELSVPTTWVGRAGNVVVAQKGTVDSPYGIQNEVKRYV